MIQLGQNLYELRFDEDPVIFYSRHSQDILDVVSHYKEKAKTDIEKALKTNPDARLAKWVTQDVKLDDILLVDKGHMRFHVGPIDISPSKKDLPIFNEELRISDEFSVQLSTEAVGHFAIFRQSMLGSKRGNLYKVATPGIFGALYFLPEDIVKSIMEYNMGSHIAATKKERDEMSKVLSDHPNIQHHKTSV